MLTCHYVLNPHGGQSKQEDRSSGTETFDNVHLEGDIDVVNSETRVKYLPRYDMSGYRYQGEVAVLRCMLPENKTDRMAVNSCIEQKDEAVLG